MFKNGQIFSSPENNGNTSSTTKHRAKKSKSLSGLITGLRVLLYVLTLIPKYWYKTIRNLLFKKPKSLSGKICLVTGAGRGLGRELCFELANLGAIVVCVDIRENANEETVKLIKESGGKAYGYTCNVAKYEEVIKLAETVQQEVGRVYLLLNNAGLIMVHNAGEWPPEDVNSMYNVNVISHYWMIQAFLPSMKEYNTGHIVNILSAASALPVPGLSIYSATKAAAEFLIGTLRMELNFNKNNKIIVSSVHPSIINTSKDIEYIYWKGSLPMLSVERVAKQIVERIRYNDKYIFVPKSFYFLALFARCIPEALLIKIWDIFNVGVALPTKEYKKNMAFHEIVHKCT